MPPPTPAASSSSLPSHWRSSPMWTGFASRRPHRRLRHRPLRRQRHRTRPELDRVPPVMRSAMKFTLTVACVSLKSAWHKPGMHGQDQRRLHLPDDGQLTMQTTSAENSQAEPSTLTQHPMKPTLTLFTALLFALLAARAAGPANNHPWARRNWPGVWP